MDGEGASDASGGVTSLRQRRPYVTALAWLAVIPFACWAAIRSGGWERDALVPLFAFTPYVAPVAVVAAAGAGAVRRWLPATVGGFAAVALIAAVVPRTVPGPRPPDPGGPTIRVLTADLYYGLADIDAVVAMARDEHADIVALQEVTPEAAAALRSAGFFERFPHAVLRPRESASGSVLPLGARLARGHRCGRRRSSSRRHALRCLAPRRSTWWLPIPCRRAAEMVYGGGSARWRCCRPPPRPVRCA